MGAEAFGIVLGSQIMAPVMFLDWPNTQDFIVTKMERCPREMTTSHYGWGVSREPEQMPERLIISGSFKTGGIWSICVDLEETVIAHADWSQMAGDEHIGSAALGLALFGLPSLILTSPVLALAHAAYGLSRMVTGMDRHTLGIWNRLKGQLMSEDVDVVHEAFLNHCNGVEAAYFDKIRAAYDLQVRRERTAMLFQNRKDDICEGPFMLRFAAGCAEPNEVMDDLHDYRHRPSQDQGVKLSEWLGMTEAEFIDWSYGRKTVIQLLEDREKKA